MHTPSQADIEQHAYQLWVDEGRPEGRAEEHWLRAKEALTAKLASTASDAAAPDEPANGTIVAGDAARRQLEEARAPQSPRKGMTDRAMPAQTGKPVWSKPHGS